jgi:hypothetical protein
MYASQSTQQPLPGQIFEKTEQLQQTLPAVITLAQADYLRVGHDLVIKVLADTWVIKDYFLNPFPLQTAEGDLIPVETVLSQISTATLVAANGAVTIQSQAKAIGMVTAVVEGPITAQDSAGHQRTLTKDTPVYLHDTISTAGRSYVEITLNDNTKLQFGPLSRFSLDKYTYEGKESEGELESNVFVGLFRYISGKISGDGGEQHTTIRTPSANIGIRGSEIDVKVEESGSTIIYHKQGLIDIRAVYGFEDLVVFEPDTRIEIPIGATTSYVEQATPEQAHLFREPLQPLLAQIKDAEVENDVQSQMDLSTPASSEDIEPPPQSPDAGTAHPFSPPVLEERAMRAAVETQAIEGEATPPQPPPTPVAAVVITTPDTSSETSVDTTTTEITLPARLSLSAVNDGPFNLGQNDSIFIDKAVLLRNDVIPPDEPITFSIVNSVNGTATLDAKGNIQFTRNDAFINQGGFDYTIKDSQGATTQAHVTIIGQDKSADTVIEVTLNEDNAQVLSVKGHSEIIALQQPSQGSIVDNQDGTLIYTPSPGFQGTDTFSYTLADQTTVTETVTVTVPSIQLPVPGEIIQLIPPQQGHVVEQADGALVYTPVTHFHGQDSFIVVLKPTDSTTPDQPYRFQVDLTVDPINDAPAAQNDQSTTQEDTALILTSADLLANDQDVDDESISIIKVAKVTTPAGDDLTQGTVSLEKGQITYTPDPDFSGQAVIHYTVADGTGTLDTAQVTIQVTPVNDAPIAVNDLRTTSNGMPLTLSTAVLLANDQDVDQDTLTITQVSHAQQGTVVLSGDQITFTPTSSATPGGFDYTVSDGQATAVGHVTVNQLSTTAAISTNQPPTALDDSVETSNAFQPLVIAAETLLKNDSDPENNSLSFIDLTTESQGQVAFDTTGNVVFTPDNTFLNQGQGTFSYHIGDGFGNTATASVVVKLNNQAPIAQNDTLSVPGNALITLTTDQLISNDYDPEGDPLTWISVQAAINGQVSSTGTGQIVFTPDEQFTTAQFGRFIYTIRDDHGHTALGTVTLTATPDQPSPNAAPIAQNDLFTTGTTAPLSISVDKLLNNDSDPEQDTLHIIAVDTAQSGQVVLTDTGHIQFTPDATFTETGSFTYEISDGQGNTAKAQVTIQRVTAADSIFELGNEDSLTIQLADLFPNAPSDLPLSLTIVPDSVVGGSLVFTETGDLLFTRNADFLTTGEGRFVYQFTDSQGNVVTAQVSLTGNVPPIAVPYEATVVKNTPIDIPLQATDPNPDEILTITAVTPIPAEQGLLSLEAGQLTFQPADNFTGLVNFAYTVMDQGGLTTAVPVKLEVLNQPPMAQADHLSTLLDTPLSIPIVQLLENDTDTDPGDQAQLQITLPSNAIEQGHLVFNGTDIIFTPAAGFVGGTQFEYNLIDSSGAQDTAIVTITVEDDGVIDDIKVTDKNTPLSIPSADLLANDREGMMITGVGDARQGTVEQQGDVLIFTPAPQFASQPAGEFASFTYTAADSQGSGQATVIITVENHVPMAENDPAQTDDPDFSTAMDTPLSLSTELLLSNDHDPDPEDLIALLEVSPTSAQGGQVALVEGQITFTPAAGFTGQDSFEYTLQDTSGAQATAVVTLQVAAPNLPPSVTLEATPLVYQGNEPMLIDSNAQVMDPDSLDFETGTLKISLAQRTPHDQLSIKNQGLITVSSPTGGQITFAGTPIGNFFTNFGTGALIISLSAAADETATTALLQSVAYQNQSPFPIAGTRTLSVVLTDGDGGTSPIASRDIQVEPPPLLIDALDDQVARPFNTPTTIATLTLTENDVYQNPLDIAKVSEDFSHLGPGVEVKLVGNEVQLFIDGLVSGHFDQATFDYTLEGSEGEQDSATVTVTPTNVTQGTPEADVFNNMTDNVDIALGGDGNDTFFPSAGADVFLGGAGDDTFFIDPDIASGVHIEGNGGEDTLSLNGADGKLLSLLQNNALPKVQKFSLQGIDKIDITAQSGQTNQLILNIKDVLDISDAGFLKIEGNQASMVASTGQGWIKQDLDPSGLYQIYTGVESLSGHEVEMWVNTAISFQLIT